MLPRLARTRTGRLRASTAEECKKGKSTRALRSGEAGGAELPEATEVTAHDPQLGASDWYIPFAAYRTPFFLAVTLRTGLRDTLEDGLLDAGRNLVLAARAAHWAFWRAASSARWTMAFLALRRSRLVAPCSPHFPAHGEKTSGWSCMNSACCSGVSLTIACVASG